MECASLEFELHGVRKFAKRCEMQELMFTCTDTSFQSEGKCLAIIGATFLSWCYFVLTYTGVSSYMSCQPKTLRCRYVLDAETTNNVNV